MYNFKSNGLGSPLMYGGTTNTVGELFNTSLSFIPKKELSKNSYNYNEIKIDGLADLKMRGSS